MYSSKKDDGPGFVGIRFCPSWSVRETNNKFNATLIYFILQQQQHALPEGRQRDQAAIVCGMLRVWFLSNKYVDTIIVSVPEL